MSEEEKHKILKGKGNPVHVFNYWDAHKNVIYATIGITIFMMLIIGTIALVIITPTVFIIGETIRANNIRKIKGISISFNCPYCDTPNWIGIPRGLKFNCCNCKKDMGYFDGKVYKITKENEKCFLTENQITNKLISKKVQNKEETSDKSNLSQIKELKELLDMGAITQEEFETKKKELLK